MYNGNHKMKKGKNMTDFRDIAMDLVEDGNVEPHLMLIACLKYMSQDEVRDMLEINELLHPDLI